MTAATAARVGVDFEEFKKATAATIPVNWTGTPDDIAAAAVLLQRGGRVRLRPGAVRRRRTS